MNTACNLNCISIKMNTKKNRKNNVDIGLPANNNYKKKGKTVNKQIESNLENIQNVRKHKKENINMPPNENRAESIKLGRRKHSESDMESPPLKKSKKKSKIQTSLNNSALDEQINSSTDTYSNKSIELKATCAPKKKKNINKSTPVETSCSPTTKGESELIELSIRKNKKSKPKNEMKSKIQETNSSFFNVSTLSPKQVSAINYNNKLESHEVKNTVEEKPPIDNANVVEMSLKDIEDTDSDLNETDIFNELDKKVEQKMDNSDAPKIKEDINWPKEDLQTLVDRMEASLPDNDMLAFSTRAEKLDWETIAFRNYTGEQCKKIWGLLQKQIRKFRLLKEILADAKEWINTPKYKKTKNSRHPDMPRKPLTAYFIYYLQNKDIYHKAHPGLDAAEVTKILGQEFKSLVPEKKLRYEKQAAKKKEEYEAKLEEFYQTHPDVPRTIKAPRIRPEKQPKPPKPPKPVKEKPPPKEKIPKRPPPPFQYYYLSELNKNETVEDKLAFKELCKERWKQMPDAKKVVWINYAETEYAKYEVALKDYVEKHPDYLQNPHKPILTKEEIQIKDRVAGKPCKPAGSPYNLFASMLLQSNEIKAIPVKHRLNFVSNQWKNCEEEEKKQYRELYVKSNEKYKLDFAAYLETLPEEERMLELQKNLPKRRQTETPEPKKKRLTKKKPTERKIVKKKLVEPEQPPITALKYFATLYTGETPVVQAWKAMMPEQKKVYEDELVKKKQAYIADFEKFLKSLTKEELEAFVNSRRKIKKETDKDDVDEEEVTSSGSEDSEAESNDEDVSE